MTALKPVLLTLFLYLARAEPPPGHNKPLGSHTTPKTIDEITAFPSPKDFFNNYIKDGKPVLIKGGLKSADDNIFEQWNDSYLRKKFGRLMVFAEHGKKEDRNKGMEDMTFRRFLDVYNDADIYMVQDLPPQMKAEVSVPYSLRCGGLQKVLSKVIMWFSSGGTKSVLHMDEFDNINCLLDGTKDLIFFDKVHGADIEADHFVFEGSYSSVDVDSVDMYKFPKLHTLPIHKVKMEPGDCLYIPLRWYHQVNSYGSRNLAVNFWFHHRAWFNTTNCENDDTWPQRKLLSEYELNEDEKLRDLITDSLYIEGDSISRDDFHDAWKDFISPSNPDNDKVFEYMDLNNDDSLTWDELYSFSVDDVYSKFPRAFGNDFRALYKETKAMMDSLYGQRLDSVEDDSIEDDLGQDDLGQDDLGQDDLVKEDPLKDEL